MKPSFRQFAAKGFTLIELLIVVIIIAILAAIAIPQFGNSTSEATDAALDANLNTVRSAIELYRVQHNNKFPGQVAATAATCSNNGVSVALAGNDEATLIAQLTQYSNRDGQTCSVPGTVGFDYGPYLRAIPREPVSPASEAAAAKVAVSAAAFGTTAPTTAPGWRFNTADGRFEVNSAKNDRNNTPYYKH